VNSKRWGEKTPNPKDYNEGRNGDHIITPFECDICIFHKLQKREPVIQSQRDRLLLSVIRRMNLDALWSRAKRTVRENTRRAKQTLEICGAMGLSGPYEHSGPYPLKDHCGYEIAAAMVMHARRPGRYKNATVQYDTVRKLRSTYSSQLRCSPQSNLNHFALTDKKGNYVRITNDKVASLWFSRFSVGLKARMGYTWKPNKAMSTGLMLRFIELIENKIEDNEEIIDTHSWIVLSTYVIITYVLSLRGSEGMMLDLGGLIKHWTNESLGYMRIVLYGKLKGENDYRHHFLPCVNVTKSGINVRYTVERLIETKKNLGLIDGSAISDKKRAADVDDQVGQYDAFYSI